jgi:tetratricopeptide (TPR) repeat protein
VISPSHTERTRLVLGRFAVGCAMHVFAFLAIGCASSSVQAEAIKTDVATYNREHTVDKLIDRGRGFAAVGDYLRAEEYLADAMNQGANPKKIMPLLLEVCIKEGRYRLAAQYAKDYLVAHPNDVPVRLVLASLYSATAENKLAKAEFERVLDARPNDAQAHYALAVLLRDAEQDVVGADQHFREYLRLDPKGRHVEEARASVLHRVTEAP